MTAKHYRYTHDKDSLKYVQLDSFFSFKMSNQRKWYIEWWIISLLIRILQTFPAYGFAKTF